MDGLRSRERVSGASSRRRSFSTSASPGDAQLRDVQRLADLGDGETGLDHLDHLGDEQFVRPEVAAASGHVLQLRFGLCGLAGLTGPLVMGEMPVVAASGAAPRRPERLMAAGLASGLPARLTHRLAVAVVGAVAADRAVRDRTPATAGEVCAGRDATSRVLHGGSHD